MQKTPVLGQSNIVLCNISASAAAYTDEYKDMLIGLERQGNNKGSHCAHLWDISYEELAGMCGVSSGEQCSPAPAAL